MKSLNCKSLARVCLLLFLTLNITTYAASLFKNKPEKPKSDGMTTSSTTITPQPKMANTIKTLPENIVQSLVVPKDSPYSEIYMQAIQNPDINSKAVNNAFQFFLTNKDGLQSEHICLSKDNVSNKKTIRNQNCLIIADYTKSKLTPRLHVFKFNENKIYNLHTAHGKGSNKTENDLIATKFSNKPNSLQTSLGFFLTDQSYSSSKNTFGPGPNNGIKLDGISCTTNNARKRFIVVHTAKYVTEDIQKPEDIGYSEGCITMAPSQKDLMLSCTNGALVYTYSE